MLSLSYLSVRPEEARWAKHCLLSLLFPSPSPCAIYYQFLPVRRLQLQDTGNLRTEQHSRSLGQPKGKNAAWPDETKDDNAWDLQKQHLPSERNLLEVIRGLHGHLHPMQRSIHRHDCQTLTRSSTGALASDKERIVIISSWRPLCEKKLKESLQV